jgi:hypothetical protein
MLRNTLVLLLDPDEMFHAADYFINVKNVKNMKTNDSWMGIMMVVYLALAMLLQQAQNSYLMRSYYLLI